MTRPRLRLVPAVLVLVGYALAAAPAAAGSISIAITPALDLREGVLTARVRVGNSGDEAAHSVAVVLRLEDQEARGQVQEALAPGGSLESTLSLPVREAGTGRFPYRLAVDYTDANGYPFQALHVGLLSVGNPPAAKMAVPRVEAEPVAKTGVLRVTLKNLANTNRRTVVAALAPEGIEATEPREDVTLGPWEERALGVPIVNRAALPGSRYPVFVTVQWDEDGVHQAIVAQGMVEIRAPQSFFRERQAALWIGAGVLVLAWVGLLAWRLTRRWR